MRDSPRDHEAGLVAFVRKEKRERIGLLLHSEKGRAKLRALLPHFGDWDAHAIVPVAPVQQTAQEIANALRMRGAPHQVYLFSAARTLDGRFLPLEEALEEVVGFAPGTFLSCNPGRLAYFEGEARGNRCILQNAQTR
jgi:hypothetical protein